MKKRSTDREEEAIYSMRVPRRILDALREIAKAEDRSTGSLVRRILEAYVRDRGKRSVR